jgi:glycosyltransferase involved in cell wall biosynthesis
MIILGIQETDWLTRGPHTQHHVFERLALNPKINITVFDYDIDKVMKADSLFIKKKEYISSNKTVQNANIKVIRTSHIQIPYLRRISSLITNFFGMLKFIRKKRPDLIIGLSLSNGMIGLFLAKLFRIPYIFYYIDLLHTLVPLGYIQSLAKIISRHLFRNSDIVIAVTQYLKNYIISEGVKEEKMKVLLNGISLENTVVDQDKLIKLKNQLDISEKDFVLFFMGYLYDFAGLREIIDYYHKNVEQGKINLKFVIVGDGGIYSSLSKYIKEIGAEWVILTGRIPFFDITEYIELADLCLMSFKLNKITSQITPVKVMEYMSMKKPVLSNSLPSVVSEIGKDNGVIFAKNQKDLIKKISQIYTKRNELEDLGKKGFELIKEKYVWSEIMNKLKSIIINLIKEKKKRKIN